MSTNSSKRLFIIAPIGSEDSNSRKRLDKLQQYIIEPSCQEYGYYSERADQLPRAGTITSHIIECLMSYELVIADLSDLNPNVFYELAIRHAVNKPVILIAEKGTKIPFDISHERVIFYTTDVEDSYKASIMLNKLIKTVESKEYENESPLKTKIQIETTKTTTEIEAIEKIYEKIEELSWEIKNNNNKLEYRNIDFNEETNKILISAYKDKILSNIRLSDRQKEIMKYISDNDIAKASQISENLSYSRLTIARTLLELVEQGLLIKINKLDGTHYQISELAKLLPQIYH